MNTPIENIPINDIVVGKRLRKDLGNIEDLAESIQKHGLLHPLTVDDSLTLIAGERRLRAMQSLGFEEVPIRRWQSLGAEDRRLIELEENIRRKDLTELERSRKKLEAAEVAGQVLSGQLARKAQQGRPSKYGVSRDEVAGFIGETEDTLRKAEKHVNAAETYPFLAQPGWKQYHAMEAAEALNKLPEDERPEFAALIDQPGIPPRDAIRTLQNVATKPEPERKKIIELAKSDDDRDRSLALTEAAAMPAMPDPRIVPLLGMVRDVKRLKKAYPNDPEVPMLDELVSQIERIVKAIQERTSHARAVS